MNNNPNSNLNDFLNKNKQNLTDDFEKDAFEGFETLNSPEDAFELKASLDKKITQKLFLEKKETKKIVWYAAAGLFLVIGLSIFFILNNTNTIVKNNNVSLITVPKNEEAKIEDKNIVATLPLETEKKQSTGTAKQNNLNKIQSIKGIEPKTLADKTAEQQLPKKGDDIDLDNLSNAKNTLPTGLVNIPASTAKADDKQLPFKAPVTVGGIKDKERDAAKDEVALSETETTNSNTDSFTKNATSSNASSGYAKQNEDKKLNTELKKETVREETNVGTSRKKEKTKSRATVKEEKPSQTSAVSAADINQKAGPENYKGDAEAKEKSIDAKSSNNQCYYNGGQNQLLIDIAEILVAKGVNKKFDATLLINEKKQVEKVIFTNQYNLTAHEKTSIETELKRLKNFNFYINPITKVLFEYKLEYKP